ncbi:MAG: efflux RND transporter permease subunit [Phycisphaerae bacterium]|jgi:Cu(I)/Ag(I) efflux system membrane protein CusA/SilA|nr:efflux RND transporter permease subunit [Phycisphaerae bacterium]
MSPDPPPTDLLQREGPIAGVMRFCLTNKLVVVLVVLFTLGWGLAVMPFDWDVLDDTLRDPVPVDAIPDTGANQQIVFTEWAGQSPQQIDDQVTYPLSSVLLNVSGVKTVRSTSMFGFSSIYVIFEDGVDFFWSRARLDEKLKSLPPGTLPPGVNPVMGPDSTSLGQVFWYTLEGRDKEGNPAGGWDKEELRTVQDWILRDHLKSAHGVSEVASVGGFVREYQVDMDPDAMRAFGVTLGDVYRAVRASNRDIGAKTIELNRVEYFVRGIGYIKSLADIETSVVKVTDNVPVLIKHVAEVSMGPALRRGAIDKDGAGAVGGVVVARYGQNPLEVINNVKAKIKKVAPTLPVKKLEDGTVSRVTVIPFYDRTELIRETLGTLDHALRDEVMITIIVVVLMVMHLRSSILIGSLLPLSVLMCFIGMKVFGVDANIVALSGIAIAIGTMVDMGIVICENILRHLDEADPDESKLEVIHRAGVEVGGAVLTAVMTTIVGFLPVLLMTGERGKLFRPLAYTKSFALIAAVAVSLTIIPPAAHLLFCGRISGRWLKRCVHAIVAVVGIIAGVMLAWWIGAAMVAFAAWHLCREFVPSRFHKVAGWAASLAAVALVATALTAHWGPLGADQGLRNNIIFVGLLIGLLLGFFKLFQLAYPTILAWCLRHKLLFLSIPLILIAMGITILVGFETTFAPLKESARRGGWEEDLKSRNFWAAGSETFPGLGAEEMPPLDEGSFLWMPSMSSHGSIAAATDYLSKQDAAFKAIPEVESVVGKIGRVESALDPAPISMVETVINYKSEYKTDTHGRRLTDADGKLIRQWRPHIKNPEDIWDEIAKVGKMTGMSGAPKLQPIETRRIMLQTGMRSPMGLKIMGENLEEIQAAGIQIEALLKQIPSVNPTTVAADRTVGKPYLNIDTTSDEARDAMNRYNVNRGDLLDVVAVAVGGRTVTTTVEGRQRFGVRVRYQRELRGDIETLQQVLVPSTTGVQIPLGQLVRIDFSPGPMSIKREAGFMVGFVIFSPKPGLAEVDVIHECQQFLEDAVSGGRLNMPPGMTLEFNVAGKTVKEYTTQQQRLYVIMGGALFAIFMILYLQFRSVSTTFMVFTGIFVAWSGGFLMLWLYGSDWFLNFDVFGVNLRDMFNMHPIKMSVAVWVGFLALFGIASDDGVVMATYLDQTFDREKPADVEAIRAATIHAGARRVRPCLMTTATTILALIPVLTSTGRGADIMGPMAIPSFGGMVIEVLTMLVVPVLYCMVKEIRHNAGRRQSEAVNS